MKLYLSRAHFPVTTLGPGRRLGIWFQGCSIRCPGCISVDTWAFGRGKTTVQSALEAFAPWLNEADGLTISGGEPFDQPDALAALLSYVRSHYSLDVLVYTGYPLERIDVERFRKLIDALITDPFEHTRLQTLPLRGSDNQRLHLLSDLGGKRFAAFTTGSSEKTKLFDIVFQEDGSAWLAGIPSPGDFDRLQFVLAEVGDYVRTSQSAR